MSQRLQVTYRNWERLMGFKRAVGRHRHCRARRHVGVLACSVMSKCATASPPQPISSGRRSPVTNKRAAKGSSGHQQHPSLLENGFGNPISQEDESIEEHFRRSLGKSYVEPAALAAQPPSPVSPPAPAQKPASANSEPVPSSDKVTTASQANADKICSVDDHFARALGDQMWTEIKARSEIASLDGLTDTVDAHFAKALGANMWKKLKEENKMVEDVSTHKQKQQQQQQSSLAIVVHNSSKTAPTSHSPVQAPLVT
ncbi:transcription cofactor vestigial-like protein 4 [Elysia marginata]|uniref:Transcription cofactor vestigial-like protein 4 n=1 Tax=Elysia marginata TaxID=1093978 RepID=A0AAV4HMH0_9GAST|nr:transcription cofactor vestigial-like protein 4 [Elysia marginata]